MKPHTHYWRAEGWPICRCDCGRWGVREGLGNRGTDGSGVRVYSTNGAKEKKREARYQRDKEPTP